MLEFISKPIFFWSIVIFVILAAFASIHLFGLWLARRAPNHGTNEVSGETLIRSIVNGYCMAMSHAWKQLKTSYKFLRKEPIDFKKEFTCYFKALWKHVSNHHWILGAAVVMVAALNEWIYYDYFDLNIFNYVSDFSVSSSIASRIPYAIAIALLLGVAFIIIGVVIVKFIRMIFLVLSILRWIGIALTGAFSFAYFAILSLIKATPSLIKGDKRFPNLMTFYPSPMPIYDSDQRIIMPNITKRWIRWWIHIPSIIVVLISLTFVTFIEPKCRANFVLATSNPEYVVIDPSIVDENQRYLYLGTMGNWVFMTSLSSGDSNRTHDKYFAHLVCFISQPFRTLFGPFFEKLTKKLEILSCGRSNSVDHVAVAVPWTKVRCSFKKQDSNELPYVCSSCDETVSPQFVTI